MFNVNMRTFSIVLLIHAIFSSADADDPFVYKLCYNTKTEDRMPLSMDNLISLIEKYEMEDTNRDPSDIAESILGRYRQNGIVYCPTSELNSWNVNQPEEAYKQDLDDLLLRPSQDVPEELYDFRSECSLHMMLSHSTDVYPHHGTDEMWTSYRSSSSRGRNKRSTISYDCLEGNDPAAHPIENGVIQTTAGPVAAGILIAGIMSKDSSKQYTVEDLLGSSSSYMPDDMKNKRIHSFYGSTISGEIGQVATVNSKLSGNNAFEVGPSGKFGNCSACARTFTLQDPEFSYLSRAELFASIDALIIREAFNRFDSYSGSEVKLSEILRMYYSDHGLFQSDVKACNRLAYLDILDDSQIQTNAVNYMYAYQDNFPQFKFFITQNVDNFEKIEREFTSACNEVITELKTFLGSYNKDDQGYLDCRKNRDEIILETQIDLVVIYASQNSREENEIEAEYITLAARGLGVGNKRSQLVVIDPGYSRWESPAGNDYKDDKVKLDKYRPYLNVADWACNFTTNLRPGGSSTQDFEDVIDDLEKVYSKYYTMIRNQEDYNGVNSQVVLWNLPQTFRGDRLEMRESFRLFRELYPDISYILAGSSTDPINDLLGENKNSYSFKDIFISTSGRNSEEIAADIIQLALKAPRMFVYPECDTSNSTYDDLDFNKERGHVYATYVTPNRTTLIKIPPQNYHYSEALKLKFSEKDFHVCISRTSKMPSEEENEDDNTYCNIGDFDLELYELCGRYVNECSPIYISATAPNKNTFCSDEDCTFPNQLKFEFTHEGMTCGAWLYSPLPFFLMLTIILVLITKI